MYEYSDVINRVKNLISSMKDANVEPFNLLMEIDGIIHGEPEPTAKTPEKTPQTPLETAEVLGNDRKTVYL